MALLGTIVLGALGTGAFFLLSKHAQRYPIEQPQSVYTPADPIDPDMPMFVFFGVLPVLVGIGVIGWQGFQFLRDGTWISVSLLDGLRLLSPLQAWAYSPATWIGVWKIANWFPASLAGITVGLGTMYGIGRKG